MLPRDTSPVVFSRRTALKLMAYLSASVAPMTLYAQEGSLQELGAELELFPEITIFKAGRVITMAGDSSDAEAVAVVGSRVLAVGKVDELITLAGTQPYTVDTQFDGKVLIAGLIDQHVHPVLAALTLTVEIIAIEDWVLPGGTSKAALDPQSYIDRLTAAEAALESEDEPLVTWGYHHYWHGQVRRPELDAISATRPIIVWHRSAHEFIVNSAAMEKLGITAEFIDGFTGAAKEQSSFESGHFYEQGGFAVMPKLASVLATKDRLFEGLNLARDYMHRAGVTLACEPGGIVSKPLQDAQNLILGASESPFRMYYMPDGKSMAQMHIDGDMIGETKAVLSWGAGRTAYLPDQVKLFADGAIYSQLMQVTEPYTDGHKGEWIMEPELFDRAFDAYWEAGYHIHIHQNGDGGLDLVLDALERNMRRMPRADHRTTIVHFGFARPDQIPRIRALGAIVSANPYYLTALSDRYAEIGLGPERADRLVPIGEASTQGISISFHSDMPMAPGQPLFLVWAAVNRTTTSGRVAGPEQRLTVEQALRAVTIDAAHSIRMEREVGSIEPGKLANFTILEADPFTVAPEAIKDIKVLATVSEGTIHPILPQGTKRAALGNSGPLFGRATFHELALAQGIVDRGMTAGCSCCQPVQNAVCAVDAPPASAAGCCSTNALGWTVAGLWSVRVNGQI
jgi:predicted amidohydrolase YtcJ